MKKRFVGIVLLPLVIAACGSSPASKLECEAVYDHIYQLSREHSLDETDLPDPLRWLQGNTQDFWNWIKDEKGKAVRNCQVTMTSKQARSCLDVSHVSEIGGLCD